MFWCLQITGVVYYAQNVRGKDGYRGIPEIAGCAMVGDACPCDAVSGMGGLWHKSSVGTSVGAALAQLRRTLQALSLGQERWISHR